MNDIIKYIGNKINKSWATSFKQLGNNPLALNKLNFTNDVLQNIENYYITDKSDGERVFLMINNTESKIIFSNSVLKIDLVMDSEYIFDCEYINNTVYIFDVIIFKGKNVSNNNFKIRHDIILKFENPSIKKKIFYPLDIQTYQNKLISLYKYNKIAEYNTDGIIFTNITSNYKDTLNYKWKPVEYLTIDFLAVKDTSNSNNYILMVGITDKMFKQFGIKLQNNYSELIKSLPFKTNNEYFPIPFYNSIAEVYTFNSKLDIHGHIVELSYIIDKKEWKFHRIRTDRDIELKTGKYFGNNYKIAELTLMSILNPLLLKDMISPKFLLSDSYFQKDNSEYKNVRKFNNYVKKMLISKFSGPMIDLASGRGGDLNKYVNITENLLMIEIDKNAIEELINRKYNILTKSDIGLNLSVLCLDLNTNYKKNIETVESLSYNKFIKNKVPTIFCHFAFHYFVSNSDMANNIISFISHFLQTNGSFIITIFDGSKVFNLLNQNNGKWKEDKYYIKFSKSVKSNIFKGLGTMIKVKLPFSEKLYEESLIDLFALDTIFKKHKMFRKEELNFANINFNNQSFSESDKKFISLYKYVIYEKR